MPTESTFLLAGLFLLLAAAGWAMGRFGERDDEVAPPPLRALHLLRHVIERAGQLAKIARPAFVQPNAQIPLGDGVGRGHHPGHRVAKLRNMRPASTTASRGRMRMERAGRLNEVRQTTARSGSYKG